MSYIPNNGGIVVDAILTRKGRELLAKGNNSFNITQFALADDEIDYSLWNSDHPLGSSYYGIVIENLPITEAVPDETQNLKSKLVTFPRRTHRLPIVQTYVLRIYLNKLRHKRTLVKDPQLLRR